MIEGSSESTKNDVMSQSLAKSLNSTTPFKVTDSTEFNNSHSPDPNLVELNNINISSLGLNVSNSNVSSIQGSELPSKSIESNSNKVTSDNIADIRHNSILKILNPEEKKYYCSVCNQGFTRKHNMVSHELIHSEAKPHFCTVCNATFRRIHDLKRHEKLHTGDKPFLCNFCHRKFARPDSLVRHQNSKNACPSLSILRESIPELQNKSIAEIQKFQLLNDYISNASDQSRGQHDVPNINVPIINPNQKSNSVKDARNNLKEEGILQLNNPSVVSNYSVPSDMNGPANYQKKRSNSQQIQDRGALPSSNQLPRLQHGRDNKPIELPPIRNFNTSISQVDHTDKKTLVYRGDGYTTTTTTITTTHRNERGKDNDNERRKHDYEHQLAVQRFEEDQRENENNMKSRRLSENQYSSMVPQRFSDISTDRSYSNAQKLDKSKLMNIPNDQTTSSSNSLGSGFGSERRNEYISPYSLIPSHNFSNSLQDSNSSSKKSENQLNNYISNRNQPLDKDKSEFAYGMYPDEYILLSKYRDLVLYTQSLEENLNMIDSRILLLETENADNKIQRARAKQVQTDKQKRKKRRKLNNDLPHEQK